MVILCGWCGKATANEDRCTSCGHLDPVKPWAQRGQEAPVVPGSRPGRPTLDATELRRRVEEAKASLKAAGRVATQAAIAEQLDVSEKTVRRWGRDPGVNAIGGPPTYTPRGLR